MLTEYYKATVSVTYNNGSRHQYTETFDVTDTETRNSLYKWLLGFHKVTLDEFNANNLMAGIAPLGSVGVTRHDAAAQQAALYTLLASNDDITTTLIKLP